MDDIYREHILDHYKNPRNYGEIRDATAIAHEENVSCGDDIEIFLKLERKSGKVVIEDVKFKGNGCALSVASASMLTEEVKGREVGKLKLLDEDFVFKLVSVEVSVGRKKCVILPFEVLKKALVKISKK